MLNSQLPGVMLGIQQKRTTQLRHRIFGPAKFDEILFIPKHLFLAISTCQALRHLPYLHWFALLRLFPYPTVVACSSQANIQVLQLSTDHCVPDFVKARYGA